MKMTRREMLLEQYEDALFALMMDEVAAVEGQKALEENRRLRESGEPVIPEEVSRRCRGAIRRRTAQKDFKRFGGSVGRVVTKVAVAALLGMLLFTTAFAASEEFRIKTLNFVMEVFDDRTEIKFTPEDTLLQADGCAAPRLTAGWLPEGFALTEESHTERNRAYVFALSGGEAEIAVNIINMEDTGLMIDTEETDAVSCRIQGREALLVNEEKTSQLSWQLDEGEKWYCYMIARNVSADALLRFAENVNISAK